MTSNDPILPRPLDERAQPDATPVPAVPGMAERMRSLVSQVSADPTIDETTSRVIGLQHAVSELATRMGKIETQLRELAAELAARSTPAQEREEITRAMHAALEQSMRAAVEQVVLMQVPKLLAAEAAKAATASEQRVTEHVDEAVLALAEALLTTRQRPAAAPATGEPPGPVRAKAPKEPKPKVAKTPANGARPTNDATNDATNGATNGVQPAAPPEPAAPARSSIGELLEDDDYVPPARHREPVAPSEPGESAAAPVPEETGRRRGWWRGSE